jgi:hypothetical protein
MLGGMRRINGGGRRNISITHVPILPEIGLGYKSGVWLSPGSHVTACEAGAVPKPPLAPHESCINGGAALLTLDEDDAKSRHERWPTPGLGSIPAQEIQPPKILPSQSQSSKRMASCSQESLLLDPLARLEYKLLQS